MGKRGRKKGDSKKNVEDFSVVKEEGLKVFGQDRENVIPQEVIDKFDVKPVGRLSDIKGSVRHFNGESYEDSLNMAYAWMTSENEKNSGQVSLTSYFPQIFKRKSILVGCKITNSMVME
jgi:hypothetical protein